MSSAHTKLLAEVLLAIGALPDAFVEKVNVVVGVNPATGQHVRSVEKGHPDIQACVRNRRTGLGLFVAGDVKTGNANLTKEQRNWRDAFIARGGGIYRVFRSVQDAIDAIEDARNA